MLDQATRLREIANRYCDQPSGERPHIITVTSGKGGAGKSTVALNLAVLFAAKGNRTLLIDADENLGNIDVMAGISPKLRLGSVLSGDSEIEDVIVSVTQNLAILPADSGNTEYRHMTIEQQNHLLRDVGNLGMRFDYVIIDTAAGLGTEVIGFSVRSNESLVVTTPEPTAVMDAYAIIKLVTAADPIVPLKLLVNNARNGGEAEDTARKLQLAIRHFLQRHVHYVGFVPHDSKVAQAVIRQRPLVNEFPFSGASLSFDVLAETLLQQAQKAKRRRFEAA